MRAERVHCEINYPRQGPQLCCALQEHGAEAPGWRPSPARHPAPASPPRGSTRPHALGPRSLHPALEGMQIRRRAGRVRPRDPASRRSSLLQLLQDRELCAFTSTSLRLCAFIPALLCMGECAKMYMSMCCQEPRSASTSPRSQTGEVPRGTWSLPPPPGGPAQRARRQRGKSKQVYCHPPAPLPTLQLRLPLATALTPHYGLL